MHQVLLGGLVDGQPPIDGRPVLGAQQKQFHILLVFWSVYCVTATDTYLDMRRWLCLVDESKSGAIFWNYFLP